MKEKRHWLWEFSKKIVVAVAILFFATVIYCCVHQWVYPDSLTTDGLLNNMSDVFKATVITYGVKAGVENALRIRKYDKDEGSEL